MTPNTRFLMILGVLFSVVFVLCAINPHDRADWALENVLTVLFVVGLAATYKFFPLSKISYTCIFIFLCLHEIGSHYTYANVPYNDWTKAVFGSELNSWFDWERNHFDRLVHFLYGLLFAYPIREVFVRVGSVKGFWGYFLPLDLTMSTSMIFELIEWGAAEYFGGDLGIAYLGTQGDIWDAHKDMALASLGALITMLGVALINAKWQRDFAQEWSDSLKVKYKKPLGDDNNI
jgi:putative membrane protein